MTPKISMFVIFTLIIGMIAGTIPLASAVSTNGTSTNQGNMRLDAGLKALGSGDIKGALTQLDGSIKDLQPVKVKEVLVHLHAAIKSLESGDTKGALTHLNQASTILTGTAKIQLEAAIKSLESGDIKGALTHLDASMKSLIL